MILSVLFFPFNSQMLQFKKKDIEPKFVFWFHLQILFTIFFILRTIYRSIIQYYLNQY